LKIFNQIKKINLFTIEFDEIFLKILILVKYLELNVIFNTYCYSLLMR